MQRKEKVGLCCDLEHQPQQESVKGLPHRGPGKEGVINLRNSRARGSRWSCCALNGITRLRKLQDSARLEKDKKVRRKSLGPEQCRASDWATCHKRGVAAAPRDGRACSVFLHPGTLWPLPVCGAAVTLRSDGERGLGSQTARTRSATSTWSDLGQVTCRNCWKNVGNESVHHCGAVMRTD